MTPPVCPIHDQPMTEDGWTADSPPWKRWKCIVRSCGVEIEKPTANLPESTKAVSSTDGNEADKEL